VAGSSHAAAGANHATGHAAAVRRQAASWVAGQVSRTDLISCDPAMCAALRSDGLPASHLMQLTTGPGQLMHSALVVATPVLQAALGPQLDSTDAPGVIASFGSAASKVQVRAVAPHGPAAYQRMLAADLSQRRGSASQFLHSGRVTFSGSTRAELSAGDVDTRLLLTLAVLVAEHPIDLVSFSDAGPDASLTVSPYRAAEFTQAEGKDGLAFVQSAMAFLRQQRAPLAPASEQAITLADGRPAVRVEFAAPSPLGLLDPTGR
jgi:hypothetical protein